MPMPTELGQHLQASANVAVLRDRIASYAVPHHLQVLDGTVAGATAGVDLGTVSLAYVKYGAAVRVQAEPTATQLCWTIPQGRMEVTVGRRQLRVQQGFLLDPQGDTVMVPDPHRGALVLTTSTSAARSQLTDLIGRPAPQLVTPPGPGAAGVGGQLALAVQYVAASLTHTPHVPALLRRHLADTLLTALLLEFPTSARLLRQEPTVGAHRLHVRRAVDWAAENFTKPVQISDWARGVAISVRHLQTAIRAEFGCTPKEYLRTLRLQRAHRLLTTAGPEQTVTSIASLSGFTHLGRFAAAYRAAYGVSPHHSRRANPA